MTRQVMGYEMEEIPLALSVKLDLKQFPPEPLWFALGAAIEFPARGAFCALEIATQPLPLPHPQGAMENEPAFRPAWSRTSGDPS